MTAKEGFGLAVRVIGILAISAGMLDLMHAFLGALGVPVAARYPMATAVGAGVVYLLVGVLVIAAAPAITKLAYRAES